MKSISPLFILLLGVAVARPLQDRQQSECAVYDECFHAPLPCPSNSISKEIVSFSMSSFPIEATVLTFMVKRRMDASLAAWFREANTFVESGIME
ncbi:hypothetical protein J3F83DRAFT_724922 [Trichoderma novae-zelandiae]